jgi:hypothetical protein
MGFDGPQACVCAIVAVMAATAAANGRHTYADAQASSGAAATLRDRVVEF